MSDPAERMLSRRRYVHVAVRAGEGRAGTVLLGLVPAQAGTEVRTVTLDAADWRAIADQLDAAAAALRTHAAGGDQGL